jgi:hypothetical protein
MLLAFFRPFPLDPNNGSLDVPLRERCEPKLEASIGRCQWEGKAIAARVVRRLIRILVRNYPSPHCNLYLPHSMLYAWSFCNTLSRISISPTAFYDTSIAGHSPPSGAGKSPDSYHNSFARYTSSIIVGESAPATKSKFSIYP